MTEDQDGAGVNRAMTMPAITAEKLVREFGAGTRAVDGIDLEVFPGEIYGFLGPNGAGKSTTVLMLTTLLPATGGKATVGGFDVARQGPQVRAAIGAALQDQPRHPGPRSRTRTPGRNARRPRALILAPRRGNRRDGNLGTPGTLLSRTSRVTPTALTPRVTQLTLQAQANYAEVTADPRHRRLRQNPIPREGGQGARRPSGYTI